MDFSRGWEVKNLENKWFVSNVELEVYECFDSKKEAEEFIQFYDPNYIIKIK